MTEHIIDIQEGLGPDPTRPDYVRIVSSSQVAIGMKFLHPKTGTPLPLVIYGGHIDFTAGDIIKARIVVEAGLDLIAEAKYVEHDLRWQKGRWYAPPGKHWVAHPLDGFMPYIVDCVSQSPQAYYIPIDAPKFAREIAEEGSAP